MSQQNDSQNLLRVEFQVHFQTGYRGRKNLKRGASPKIPEYQSEDFPRLTRLLALAYRWNRLIEEGAIIDYAEIASIMGLSRARITQIMDLLYLAPKIQEEILLPAEGKPATIPERAVRSISMFPTWGNQCKAWKNITGGTS